MKQDAPPPHQPQHTHVGSLNGSEDKMCLPKSFNFNLSQREIPLN